MIYIRRSDNNEFELLGEGEMIFSDSKGRALHGNELQPFILLRPVLSGTELIEAANQGKPAWTACWKEEFDELFHPL